MTTRQSPITQTRFFIIASGPSLTKQDVDSLKGQKVIAINDNYLLAPWADYMYACDPIWWMWHKEREELKAFKGQKWTQRESWEPSEKTEVERLHKLNWVDSKCEMGLSTDPAYIHQGSNSGIQAINLAYHFGARSIVLLGFDMQETNGKAHWFGEHPNNSHPKFSNLMKFYKHVADQAPALGLEIINATRETALTCFKREKLADILTSN